MTLDEAKYALHKARVSRDYWRNSTRTVRKGMTREEGLANAQAEVDRFEPIYHAMLPVRITMKSLKENFIGPVQKWKRHKRPKDGPITCCKCAETKPREEFYETGTRCKSCYSVIAAEWGEKNPVKRRESQKSYHEKDIDKARATGRAYASSHKVERLEYGRKYASENKEKINAKNREYLRRRKKIDPRWRAFLTCKRRLWILIKSAGVKKDMRTAEFIGIDRAGFYAHIESLFLPGMTWENRSLRGWHIDHIIPCSFFDHSVKEQAKACWHYTNLRPMWAYSNLSKSDILPCGARGRNKRLHAK